MKLLSFLTVFLIITIPAFTGCTQKNAKHLIINKWKLTEGGSAGANKTVSLKGAMWEFTKEGTVIMNLFNEKLEINNYILSEDEKTLFIVNPKTQSTTILKIEKITNSTLITLGGNDYKTKLVFIPN